ncbi:MAG TPA: hypothetical protein VMV62_02575 [Candidatus Paceibacterota bacterium]|nr:hypothetical protein [Candidatus Paceibacterota bacterium]
MAKTFHLTIARVGENLFDGDVASVSLPGVEGTFEVLAGHEAFVSELAPGPVRATSAEGERFHLEIAERGVAEISQNQATILL